MASGAESVGIAYAVKWLMGIVGMLVGGFTLRWGWGMSNKVNNTYSKDEVNERIETKVVPLQRVVEENTNAIKECNTTNQQLCVLIARLEERVDASRTRRKTDGAA